MNKKVIIILLLLLLVIVFIVINKSNEFFDCIGFEKNLTHRINNVQNPYDHIWPLTPRGITYTDCELCVFKKKYESNGHGIFDYGDYIPKRMAKIIYPNLTKNDYKNNKGCPPNTKYMNSCVYIPSKI